MEKDDWKDGEEFNWDKAEKGFKKLDKQCYIEGDYIVLNVRFPYDIELSRCNTHKKILHWVWHLAPKNWVNQLLLWRFIELACKYHNLEMEE